MEDESTLSEPEQECSQHNIAVPIFEGRQALKECLRAYLVGSRRWHLAPLAAGENDLHSDGLARKKSREQS